MPLTPSQDDDGSRKLRELFTGSTLDAAIEAGKVRGLDEFMGRKRTASAVDWFNGKVVITFPKEEHVPQVVLDSCVRMQGGDRDWTCDPSMLGELKKQGFELELRGSLSKMAFEKEPHGSFAIYDGQGAYITEFSTFSKAAEFAKKWSSDRLGAEAEVVDQNGSVLARFPPSAHESEPREHPISDPRGFLPFRNWAVQHKKAEAGTMELDSALDEAKRAQPRYTANEAIGAVKASQDSSDHPWSDISSMIDFNSLVQEEEAKRQATEAAEIVKAALQAGFVTPRELQLYRVPVETIIRRQEGTANKIRELRAEVERLRKEKEAPAPAPQAPPVPQRPTAALSMDMVELLANSFSSIIKRRTKREPFPTEMQKFDDLVAQVQRVKPPLSYTRAKEQVDNLARQLSEGAMKGRLTITRGRARVDQLLDKQLTAGLTVDEADELRRIQEGEEFTSVEEVQYAPPRIELVAEAVPPKYPRKDVPFVIQRIWESDAAEREKERLEKLGFTIAVRRTSE